MEDIVFHHECCCLPFESHTQRMIVFNDVYSFKKKIVVFNSCYIKQLFENIRLRQRQTYNSGYHVDHVFYYLASLYVKTAFKKLNRNRNTIVWFTICDKPRISEMISFREACEIFIHGSTNRKFLESFEHALKKELETERSSIPKTVKEKHRIAIKKMMDNPFSQYYRNNLIDILADVIKYTKKDLCVS